MDTFAPISQTIRFSADQADTLLPVIELDGWFSETHAGVLTVSSTAGAVTIPITLVFYDSGHDQIPGGWEKMYLGSAAYCNPRVASDGDTQTNRDEWIGGNAPTRTDRVLAITTTEIAPRSNNTMIHWPSLPERTYDIVWSLSATEPFLTPGCDLPHMETNYCNSTSAPRRFCRVCVAVG